MEELEKPTVSQSLLHLLEFSIFQFSSYAILKLNLFPHPCFPSFGNWDREIHQPVASNSDKKIVSTTWGQESLVIDECTYFCAYSSFLVSWGRLTSHHMPSLQNQRHNYESKVLLRGPSLTYRQKHLTWA
jgi:hypothetical protein